MSEREPVLRALRVKGRATAAALAEATGLPVGSVEEALAAADAGGLARERTGRLAGWTLTPDGAAGVAAAAVAARPGLPPALGTAYRAAFLPLNGRFKALCVAAQVERTDPAAALTELHADATRVLAELAAAAPWLAGYGPRLGAAAERVTGGDPTALARPLSGSYHDVWIELHEDLLLTLGEERAEDD